MEYSILEVLNLTFSAIVIVLLVLTLIMFAINIVGKLVGQFEAKHSIISSTTVSNPTVSLEKSVKEMFEQDPYAQVAALVALTQASNNEQDKRFEVVRIIKK